MKVAVTGCNGSVGKPVVALALKRGLTIVGIDRTPPPSDAYTDSQFTFIQVDLTDYDKVLKVLEGCDGVIHLAAHRNPGDYKVETHNNNVVLSWNVLRACAELNITRVVQASSVNVLPLVFSQIHRFEYFPLDERHPCLPDEPYGLSKVICELQADTIVRRYPDMRIASLRLSWSVPSRSDAERQDSNVRKRDLWGYVQEDAAADAFILAATDESGQWCGHEAFFITAPSVAAAEDVDILRQTYYPEVPWLVKEGKHVSHQTGFFDCGKAERLMGWVHRDALS